MSEWLRDFRPPSSSEFAVRFEDRVAERAVDLMIFQSTERWGYFGGKELVGVVSLRGQRLGSPHGLDVRVLPTARGEIERGLVAFALERLGRFPTREIQARVLTSHVELVNALADAGFIPTRGLTLMAKKLK
jgi:hypothetical protein